MDSSLGRNMPPFFHRNPGEFMEPCTALDPKWKLTLC